MPLKDIFSRKLRFSRRQVTKRPYVLSSLPVENGQQQTPARKAKTSDTRSSGSKSKILMRGRAIVQIASSQLNEVGKRLSQKSFKKVAVATPKNQRRHIGDLSQSSPLVPLDEQDENYLPKPQPMDSSQNSSPCKAAVTNRSSILSSSKEQSKDSQNTQETPPPPPVEFSYLASTPLPGKQQLRRQRPFTPAREVNQSNNKSSSKRSTKSTAKVPQQEQLSFNNLTQKRSSIKASQPFRPFKTNSDLGSGKRDLVNPDESPADSRGKSKKKHGSVGRDSAASVEMLTKALSEKRISKHREKQSDPANATKSSKDGQLQPAKGKEKVNSSSTASNRLHQPSALARDSLENASSDSSRDIENKTINNKGDKSYNAKSMSRNVSVDKLRRPIMNQVHNKENKVEQLKAAAEKSTSKILTNQNTSNSKIQERDIRETTQSATENNKHGTINKSTKHSGSCRRGTSVKNDATASERIKVKTTIKALGKCSKEGQMRNARRKRVSSESGSEAESQEDTAQKQNKNSKDSLLSSTRKKRRISSDSESEDESQKKNIQIQKRSSNERQMKRNRETLGNNKKNNHINSARQTINVASDNENDDQSQETTTEREPLHKGKTTTKINQTNAEKKKQAAGSDPKKKARFNITDNDELGPDQTMMVWGSDDMKRKRSDLVDVDVVLNSFSEVLESQIDVCESETEQRAVRTLEKYLTQDITNMIRNVQNVNSLQRQVRKKEQELKQKRIHLISLQDKRLELEEKGASKREQNHRHNNIKEINSFIQDLQELIEMC